jgi:hypothetical protein
VLLLVWLRSVFATLLRLRIVLLLGPMGHIHLVGFEQSRYQVTFGYVASGCIQLDHNMLEPDQMFLHIGRLVAECIKHFFYVQFTGHA